MKKKLLTFFLVALFLFGVYLISKSFSASKSRFNHRVLLLDKANTEILKIEEEQLTYLFNHRTPSEIEQSDWKQIDSLILHAIKTYNIFQLSNSGNQCTIDVNDFKFYFVPMLNTRKEKLIYALAVNSYSHNWWSFYEILKNREGSYPIFSITMNLDKDIQLGVISNCKS